MSASSSEASASYTVYSSCGFSLSRRELRRSVCCHVPLYSGSWGAALSHTLARRTGAAPVPAVGPLAQKVEHLREGKGHDKVVGGVGVADQEEKGRPFIPQSVHVPFFLRPLKYDIGHQRAVFPIIAVFY